MPSPPEPPSRSSAGPVLRWDDVDGVPRFTACGDLDLAVHAQVAAALAARPPGSAPLAEIDLGAVTFFDVGTARLFYRYVKAAADRGGEVRIVNATEIQRRFLHLVGSDAAAGWFVLLRVAATPPQVSVRHPPCAGEESGSAGSTRPR